ncbi:MAG TPA: DUF262 domain-containing protein [Myxococcaceae bacterium]|jgi:hypothetical protein
MSSPAYVTEPTVVFLHQILEDLARGYMQVPKFQREFVWSDDQRLELLQSIRDGIPIGSILVWRTSRTDLRSLRAIGPHELAEPRPSPTSARTYILDGLQRLSTLYGCLRPLTEGREPFTETEDGDERSWRVGYDLVEEEFTILQRDEQANATWLPLSILHDSIQLLQFQRGLVEHPQFKEFVKRSDTLADAFRVYKLPVVPIATDDLAGATRTFERVNRQGTPMTELQMVRALTWKNDFDLEEQLEAIRDRLKPHGWEKIDLDVILRACKAAYDLDISTATPDALADRLKEEPQLIEEVAYALEGLVRWFVKRFKILSPLMVPYRVQTIILTDAIRRRGRPLDSAAGDALFRWFWLTTYAASFAGASGGRILSMLRDARDIARGKKVSIDPDRAKIDLSTPARFVPRNVRVLSSAQRLAELGPLDLDGKPINAFEQLAAAGPAAMVAIVQQRGASVSKGIANRMFSDADDRLRVQFLRDVTQVGPEILASHAISQDAATALQVGDYEAFGHRRSKTIQDLESAFLASLLPESLQ